MGVLNACVHFEANTEKVEKPEIRSFALWRGSSPSSLQYTWVSAAGGVYHQCRKTPRWDLLLLLQQTHRKMFLATSHVISIFDGYGFFCIRQEDGGFRHARSPLGERLIVRACCLIILSDISGPRLSLRRKFPMSDRTLSR